MEKKRGQNKKMKTQVLPELSVCFGLKVEICNRILLLSDTNVQSYYNASVYCDICFTGKCTEKKQRTLQKQIWGNYRYQFCNIFSGKHVYIYIYIQQHWVLKCNLIIRTQVFARVWGILGNDRNNQKRKRKKDI